VGIFKRDKTLEELETENEELEIEETNMRHKAQIAKLKKQIDAQGGQGFWKKVVGDSKGNGALQKMTNWFKSH